MRVGILLMMMAMTVLPDTALTANNLKGCFQKVYDKSYLKKVENQFVTTLQIDIGKSTLPSSKPAIAGKLRAKFRDDSKVWWNGKFECIDGGASWSCVMECDGGTFILSQQKSGLQLVNQSFLRFNKENCDTDPRDVRADVEHTTFTMPQISSGACKK